MKKTFALLLVTLLLSCNTDYRIQDNYDFPIYTCELILSDAEAAHFTSGGLNENWNYGQLIDDHSHSLIRIKVRGGISKFYQKKNYKIEKLNSASGKTESSYFWDGTAADVSHIKNALVMAFLRKNSVPASTVTPTAVYLNKQYYGFYQTLEPVDENFFKSRNIQLEFLIKAGLDKCDFKLDYNGIKKFPITDGFEIKYPENSNCSELAELIENFYFADDAQRKEIAENRLNIESFITHLAVLTIFSLSDVYAKNYYLYRSDGKWGVIAWDNEEFMKRYASADPEKYWQENETQRNLLFAFFLSENGYRKEILEKVNNLLTEENGKYLVDFTEETYSAIEKAVIYDRNTNKSIEEFYSEKEKLLSYIKKTFPLTHTDD
ncbi:MAG: CotH kinase family protein [Spirochaetales bacterium]|nr:CotH kinase family protein [Spirochaetales bacterium]